MFKEEEDLKNLQNDAYRKGMGKTARVMAILFALSVASFALVRLAPLMPGSSRTGTVQDTTKISPANLQDSLFKAILSKADALYRQKKYDQCLAEFEKAIAIKPDDSSLKSRIVALKGLIAQQKKSDEDYAEMIRSADKYFAAKDYLNAKATYQLAIDTKPEDTYAKNRLNETMTLLRSQKAQNILYDVALANADRFFQAKDYEKAKAEYEKAGQINPAETYPKEKINEIIKIQVDAQVREELYAQSITKADGFYNAKKYASALGEYKNALKQKPDEQYPKERIKELTDLLNTQKATDEAYQKAIVLADQLFNDKSYPDARNGYLEAGKIKPQEAYPKNRIREIDDILAAMKRRDEEYDRLIAAADSFYIGKDFLRARMNYQQALQVKPEESYPKEMLNKTASGLAGAEQSQKALDESYNAIIAGADKLLADKKYPEAKQEYTSALALKPAESYPKTKIVEIDKALADLERQKTLDSQYASVISQADSLLTEKSYEPAKARYNDALKIKPAETYPRTKISEIDGIVAGIAKEKADFEARYAALIAGADKLFTEKSYSEARDGYSKALEMKPGEKYPTGRISEIDGLLASLAKQKELDDQYSTLVTGADKLLTEKSYEPAKAEYQKALAMKPAEAYPKTKIAEIDKALADIAKQKSIDDQYNSLITDADRLLGDKSYESAKAQYNAALKLKPEETYPKTKITEIDGILAGMAKEMADFEARYAALIAGGDKLFTEKSYTEAKGEYTKALGMKPGEKYPTDRIAEIDGLLTSLAKQKELDDQYNTLVTGADKLLAEKSYEPAKAEYQKALVLKPAETYPKTKIAEIDKTLADIAMQKSIDDQYNSLITDADRLLGEKSYDPAKAQYNAALKLKPEETYPKTKITEIDGILAGMAKEKADFEARYAALIAGADKLFTDMSYAEAKGEYTKALGMKPGEKHPTDRIAEIDGLLASLAKQKELDDQYSALVTGADKLLAEKSYEPAKTEYQKALVLKPAETYPKTKIAEIDMTLADIAKQKSIDDQYNSLITDADRLLGEKSYEPAKAQYNAALKVKPEEAYPKTKITEIDGILAGIAKEKADFEAKYAALIAGADKLFTEKSYAEAKDEYAKALGMKPGEKYPTDRITEIDGLLADIAKQKELDDRYNTLITGADKLLAAKSYEPAKADYQKASALKPGETYPKTKITEIDAALAEIARQNALDEQYAGVVLEADQLLAGRSYEPAKEKYNAALALKPEETYPKTKISEIDGILAAIAKEKADFEAKYLALITGADKLFTAKSYSEAKTEYTKALDMKPGEKYAADRITEIDAQLASIARQKELDEQYAVVIAGADKLLAAKSYGEARAEYQKALALKPAEGYPKVKSDEIDKTLADIARQKEMEAARLKAIEDQYTSAISAADKFYATKAWEDARNGYSDASKIKPNEQYPKDRITEIDGIITELARQKAVYDRYKDQVTQADQLYNAKSYEQARTAYEEALKIKPDEQHPKDRITAIESILAELKAQNEAYQASVTKGDQLFADKNYDEARKEFQNANLVKPTESYPREKISEINRLLTELQGKKATYDKLILTADGFLALKEYARAKDDYTQASGIFPEESYPKERIAFVTSKIDSIYRANKAGYDKAVANGDKFFNAYEFDKAVDAFSEASALLPMENYPKEMIARIRKTIADNAIVDVLKNAVVIKAGDEKKFNFEPVNIASRKDNFIYMKIKNLSGKQFNVLVRYGKDAQAGGGVVIRNLTTDGAVNDRLINVRDQDPWYRNDNNWIGLAPQGGDIEVSFIQVSRVIK